MLYRPSPSVWTVRDFSISAGLAASTVTPGRARPELSLTEPEMPLACWADAERDPSPQSRTRQTRATDVHRRCHVQAIPTIDAPRNPHRLRLAYRRRALGYCIGQQTGRSSRNALATADISTARLLPADSFVSSWTGA